MDDKITVTFSVGEFFTVRAALDRWQLILDGYATKDMTETQTKDVAKFKAETKRALEALVAARSKYYADATGPSHGAEDHTSEVK